MTNMFENTAKTIRKFLNIQPFQKVEFSERLLDVLKGKTIIHQRLPTPKVLVRRDSEMCVIFQPTAKTTSQNDLPRKDTSLKYRDSCTYLLSTLPTREQELMLSDYHKDYDKISLIQVLINKYYSFVNYSNESEFPLKVTNFFAQAIGYNFDFKNKDVEEEAKKFWNFLLLQLIPQVASQIKEAKEVLELLAADKQIKDNILDERLELLRQTAIEIQLLVYRIDKTEDFASTPNVVLDEDINKTSLELESELVVTEGTSSQRLYLAPGVYNYNSSNGITGFSMANSADSRKPFTENGALTVSGVKYLQQSIERYSDIYKSNQILLSTDLDFDSKMQVLSTLFKINYTLGEGDVLLKEIIALINDFRENNIDKAKYFLSYYTKLSDGDLRNKIHIALDSHFKSRMKYVLFDDQVFNTLLDGLKDELDILSANNPSYPGQ